MLSVLVSSLNAITPVVTVLLEYNIMDLMI